LGAGVKLANLQFRSKKEKTEGFIREIKTHINKKIIKTQMEKLGAIIGDFVEIGCNAVTCPGTFLEKNVQIFPNMIIPKGLYKENSMLSR
jgi:UDP-3-O-[3-hydroxymyristoyl] glucosamine N-acyltransferase